MNLSAQWSTDSRFRSRRENCFFHFRLLLACRASEVGNHLSMTLNSWLEQGPFTLALSSGYFGFFAHTGFLKALVEAGYTPSAFAGSSSGAIVSGAAAAGLAPKDIETLVLGIRRADFWDPTPGLGLIRGRKLERLLETYVGSSFQSLQSPLRVATFDLLKCQTRVFDRGPLARVIRASASIPIMFHPVSIDRSIYCDGGIRDKMGTSGLETSQRVLGHHLSDGQVFGREIGGSLFGDSGKEWRHSLNRKLIALKGLPRSGPNKLDRGADIIQAAYRQTRELLTDS